VLSSAPQSLSPDAEAGFDGRGTYQRISDFGTDCVLSGGCVVSGAVLRRSLLYTGTRVHPDVHLEDAVVLPGVEIARSARLTKVIVDQGVQTPEGLMVREDSDVDAQRFQRTDRGFCLVTQPMLGRLGETGRRTL
jgi:glucose-1-phosphate adenylyltransferase